MAASRKKKKKIKKLFTVVNLYSRDNVCAAVVMVVIEVVGSFKLGEV